MVDRLSINIKITVILISTSIFFLLLCITACIILWENNVMYFALLCFLGMHGITFGIITGKLCINIASLKKILCGKKTSNNNNFLNLMYSELVKKINMQKYTIRQLEESISMDRKINSAMELYFDALHKELLKIVEQRDKELRKDQFIDRVMENIYDNIHVALDKIVKDKSDELKNARKEIGRYSDYVSEMVYHKTKHLSEENQRLKEIAMTDDLTGLSNRRGFYFLVKNRLKQAVEKKLKISLLFVDLDGLKTVNDTFGHDEGDYVLREAAWILCKSLRGDDLISRYGGDEFILFIETEDVNKVLERIADNAASYNHRSARPYHISLSIGYKSLVPNFRTSIERIIRQADRHMYKMKSKKKLNGILRV